MFWQQNPLFQYTPLAIGNGGPKYMCGGQLPLQGLQNAKKIFTYEPPEFFICMVSPTKGKYPGSATGNRQIETSPYTSIPPLKPNMSCSSLKLNTQRQDGKYRKIKLKDFQKTTCLTEHKIK